MILDADGNIMQNAYLGLRPGEDGIVTLTIADCEADTFLTGTSNPGLIVEISEADADDWSRIDTNSLDLTPYDGTDQDFDIRFTDDRPDTLRDRVEFRLTISGVAVSATFNLLDDGDFLLDEGDNLIDT
jgi:hypothetical protein